MVSSAILILLLGYLAAAAAFQSPSTSIIESRLTRTNTAHSRRALLLSNEDEDLEEREYDVQNVLLSRRSAIAASVLSTLSILPVTAAVAPAIADQGTAEGGSLYEPKFVQTYDDFTSTSEGWSYKDVKIGNKDDGGGELKDGDRVVFDWSGYTIGYFGRPFEAKG